MGSSPWLACHRWVWLCLFFKWANWDPERSGDSSEIIPKGRRLKLPRIPQCSSARSKTRQLTCAWVPAEVTWHSFPSVFLSVRLYLPLSLLLISSPFSFLWLPFSFSPSPFKKNFFAFSLLLFLAVLGLHCYLQAFSNCSDRGPFASCSVQASHCCGFSSCGALDLGYGGSVVVSHGLSFPVACEIFPDQGSNPCPLHWQEDS